MKAVSATYAVPEAAVDAIRAGCDAVLVCSGDVDLQARTLETLVRAVESGAIPAKRHDDAFVRLKRTKERFILGDRPGPSARIKALRNVLGREEHQLVAAEMASFL
jgi:beta-glucosidase-like glycosyl hydrolase